MTQEPLSPVSLRDGDSTPPKRKAWRKPQIIPLDIAKTEVGGSPGSDSLHQSWTLS